jgi:hypothetical protein
MYLLIFIILLLIIIRHYGCVVPYQVMMTLPSPPAVAPPAVVESDHVTILATNIGKNARTAKFFVHFLNLL